MLTPTFYLFTSTTLRLYLDNPPTLKMVASKKQSVSAKKVSISVPIKKVAAPAMMKARRASTTKMRYNLRKHAKVNYTA